MKEKKEVYIIIDGKKQRDINGKIVYHFYKDAKRIYKGLRAKGIDATCGQSIAMFFWIEFLKEKIYYDKYEKSEKITRKKGALEQKTHSNAFS